ncbi:DUF2235 domain-containing protein [Ostreiculturibacter nitratireducens]|uniref:DUF2235 domain-containing protein n=1 Tax=Ostreiculturibacter nitratireducens TaxID=3075226 RepID=UPI003CCC70D9
MLRQFTDRILRLLRVARRVETHAPMRGREPCDHVILLDGTMSSLEDGEETNIGLIYKLLLSMPIRTQQVLYYEAGVQWRQWRNTTDVAMGRGINRQIRRTYGWLASHYRPGDRIFLFGYSRGAFAVRSLAGMIDQVGLLRADAATERNITLAYRYYQAETERPAEKEFVRRFCHTGVDIQMLGVFDTVKALGLRLPLLWVLTEPQHRFHNQNLGPTILNGFHALALDETRSVYEPVLWECPPEFRGHVEQVWFRGTHGDIGGQLGGEEAARPLSNIPLAWMLERAEAAGLTLPPDWRGRFLTDPEAPSIGTWSGWGKVFLFRAPRVAGNDPSERLHPTALGHRKKPRAFIVRPIETLGEPVSGHP